jgi:sterol desaturase/sphingolipid hydroxylase (fatty acid hydroxylase superfamily)
MDILTSSVWSTSSVWLTPSLWFTPSLLLGAVFTITTALLTLGDLDYTFFFKQWQIGERPAIHGQDILHVLPVSLKNIVITGPVIFTAFNLRVLLFGDQPFITQPILWLLSIYFVSQVVFWCMHYMVHSSKTLYTSIHQQHHEYTKPFALTAIYCTTYEMLLLNLPAVFLGQLIFLPTTDSLFYAHCFWLFLVGIQTPFAHSGLTLFGSQYHDLHHQLFQVNFGSPMMDKLFGVYREEKIVKKRLV